MIISTGVASVWSNTRHTQVLFKKTFFHVPASSHSSSSDESEPHVTSDSGSDYTLDHSRTSVGSFEDHEETPMSKASSSENFIFNIKSLQLFALFLQCNKCDSTEMSSMAQSTIEGEIIPVQAELWNQKVIH